MMDDKIVFTPPLSILKDQNPLSHPQKCKIPHKSLKFPASNLVKLKSGKRTFVCRLYYLSEIYDNKSIAYVDDCVEIVKQLSDCGEIKSVNELELIKDPEVEFSSVKLKLIIDASSLDLNIIKSPADIAKVTKALLKNYTFSRECTISIACRRFGFVQVQIVETKEDGFGSLTEECVLVIDEIMVEKGSMLSSSNSQLGGLAVAESELTKFIERNQDFMRNPHGSFKPSSHCLLIGPGGCGKTTLIHHVARKIKCNIFAISADIFMPYPGETEHELEKIFTRIKKISSLLTPANPTIILIENIEIFCPTFNAKIRENSHSSRIASQIFSFLDDISLNCHEIMVIGTTSKVELVNSSLRRSSRMGFEILLDMPNEQQRYEILKVLWSSQLSATIEFNDIVCKLVAESTPGFVGADLEILCQFVARQRETTKTASVQNLFENALRGVTPSVMRDNLGIVTRSSMKLDDIGGMEELKKSLRTAILGPLKYPEKFHRLGLRSPSGILLYGPSGCAKTTIVKCLAGESKMTLISVSSAEIYSPYVGEAEKFIVRLFNQARMSAPAILFFDEIDTIVGSRSDSGSDTHMGILSTLLTEIDGFGGDSSISRNKPILIIGATNRPEHIDDALLRPGRFDKLIHVPAPDTLARTQILSLLLRKMPIDTNVDIETLAKRTEKFSGADLVNLCNEAALHAATRDINCEVISRDDFENVLAFLRSSLCEEKIRFYEKFERQRGGGGERVEVK